VVCHCCVLAEHRRRRLYKGRGGRETKGRRAGTAFSPRGGNSWRETGAAGRGGANSTATIDSVLIYVGPLGALMTQTDRGQKIADFLSTARRKQTKSDAIWTQNMSARWTCPKWLCVPDFCTSI
jgi:hypothetical protein